MRLFTGCFLFFFATTHFLTAGMGLFGVEAADAVRNVSGPFWSFPPMLALLYGSMLVHLLLGLKSIAFRRSWRMPALEAVQIILGLLIPIWLTAHIVATRGVKMATGVRQTYQQMYQIMWPDLATGQATLLIIVWLHGCIGLYMVWRLRPWFPRWREPLLAAAVGIPLFSLAGFLAGMREADRRFSGPTITAEQVEAFNRIILVFEYTLWAFAAAAMAVLLIRLVKSHLGEKLTIRFADGPTVRAAPGATLLDISRRNGVAHASVCGGRARCSTCRVRILEGGAQPEPNKAERRLLARIGAPESVRLACQLVPAGDITVQRLVDAGDAARRENHQVDPFRWGVERNVTLLFTDIRGFTAIAEKSVAFDVVFVLNRFLTEMSAAIVASGGRIDKYLGDGLMAIFGADGSEDAGSRAALNAVQAMGAALDALNREFEPLLGQNLRIGVGIHTGQAILGRIGGGGGAAALTALGDTVNIAARLEEMTKTFRSVAVISEDTFSAAGVDPGALEAHEVAIRGREKPLVVRAMADFSAMTIA